MNSPRNPFQSRGRHTGHLPRPADENTAAPSPAVPLFPEEPTGIAPLEDTAVIDALPRRVPGPADVPGITAPIGDVTVVWEHKPPAASWDQTPETMRRILAALNEPGARLRTVLRDANHPWVALTGKPRFAGLDTAPDGKGPMAGLWLDNEDTDGRLVFDVTDPEWLRHLIGAAYETLDALEHALETPEVPETPAPEGEVA